MTPRRTSPPRPCARAAASFLASLLALAAPLFQAVAADDKSSPIRIELNKLETRAEGCRVWLVVGNPGAEALDPLRLDLVLFGRDGVVSRRLAVDAGPLPAGKTSARIFDVAGLACDDVGSVLLNDVLACGGVSAEQRAACVSRATLSSRAGGVPFGK